jgi:hypothetical protein
MNKLNSKIRALGYLGICFTIIIVLMAITGTGCGGDDSKTETGTLSLSLTDDPASVDYSGGVYVTITEIRAHTGVEGTGDEVAEDDAGWVKVATPNKTYNLLELTNCNWVELGIAELETGHYTQMRLYLDDPNYVVDSSGVDMDLTVPSGYQTGIKLVKGFDIEKDKTTELLLDFDALKSIVKEASSGKLILNPTIKVLNAGSAPVVTGTIYKNVEDAVTHVVTQVPVPGAIISAGDVTSTESDENGDYCLTLEAGTYNIDATYTDATEGELKGSVTGIEVQDGDIINGQDITVSITIP